MAKYQMPMGMSELKKFEPYEKLNLKIKSNYIIPTNITLA
jgi:hypothetical protein